MLQIDPELVDFQGGRVSQRGASGDGLDFAAVVEQAYLARLQLSAAGFYSTPGLQFDWKTGQGTPFHYFAYGAAVSEVQVDGFTGQYQLLRADLLHDVGDSLSPLVDRGQVEGGFVQGAGWLTCEELVWNDAGVLTTPGASTYKLPSLHECPPEFHVALLQRASEPGVVHGSKAVGEPPLMLALSVREALRAAIAAFAAPGQKLPELPSPLTPEATFFAIEHVRSPASQKRDAAE